MQSIQWNKWGVIISLSTLLIAAGLFSYQSVQQSQMDLAYLTEQDLPLLDQVQELRTALVAIESTVYGYYVDTDWDAFQSRYQRQINSINQVTSVLQQRIPQADELLALILVKEQIKSTSLRFEKVMLNRPIDWDGARDVLAKFAPLTEQANQHSEALTRWIRNEITQRSEKSLQRIQTTVWVVGILAGIASLAALFLTFTNVQRLRALKEQERLATYPQRNPHPVLTLNQQGEITYANAACHETGLILPTDINKHLNKNTEYKEWEFKKDGVDYHIGIHWLADYHEYHVYVSDISARKKAERHLEYLAFFDALTGLPNRRQFNSFINEQLAKKHFQPFQVVFLDIDNFHRSANVGGHSVSEKLSKEIAERLSQALDNSRLLATNKELFQLKNNLFGLFYQGSSEPIEKVIEEMCEAVAQPLTVDEFEFFMSLTVSIVRPEFIFSNSSDEIIRMADTALSQGKQQGGNLIVYYDPEMDKQHQIRIEIENGLQHVIQKEELVVFYQPKLCLQTGKITGTEALLRWIRPESGMVSPDQFIPIAEDSGQIIPIGEWVLTQACKDAVNWNQQFADPVNVAVNLSSKQLLHSNIVEVVKRTLNETGLPASSLELEITESAALTDFDMAIDQLTALHELGIKLSLDDFGTGYSSLSYLHKLPVQSIKIDRSFTQNLSPGNTETAITHSVIKLAQHIGLSVIAEGVETREQLQQFADWQCDHIQGYLIGKPMPFDQFLAFNVEHIPAQWMGTETAGSGHKDKLM